LKPSDFIAGLKERTHLKLLFLGEPSLNWHSELGLQFLADIEPSGGARSRISVFVGATNSKIDAVFI